MCNSCRQNALGQNGSILTKSFFGYPAMAPPNRITAKEIMGIGLNYFKYFKWEKYSHEANVDRFKSQYGVIPETAAAIWNAMIDSENEVVKLVKGRETKPKYLLLSLRWLFAYETERQIGPHFDIHSTTTTSKYLKRWVRKIQLLLFPLVSAGAPWRMKLNFDFIAPLVLTTG